MATNSVFFNIGASSSPTDFLFSSDVLATIIYQDARAELREAPLISRSCPAVDREARGSSVGWNRVAAINSKPPIMAVFLKKFSSCGVKRVVPDACQKACAVNVAGSRKANIATAASRG
jgi:hypothetical protein